MWLRVSGLVITLALAAAAFAAARSHRVAAERVLRDYAGVAASEFVRRTAFDVGFNGLQPAGAALRGGQPMAPMVRGLIGAEPAVVAAPEPAATLDPFVVRHRVVDGRAEAEVRIPTGDSTATALSFPLRLAGLVPYARHSLARGPLLPSLIGDGQVGNQILSLVFLDPAGGEVFRSGAGRWPEWEVEVPFGDFYRGVLDGYRVRVAIDPATAALLVPGGLPGSQLPALAALVAGAVALAVLAARQGRRERAFVALRQDFVAGVSHELRTPLAQIRLFTETVLLGRCRSDEERRRFLKAAARETVRLGHLVDNILDFSRAERGRLDLAPATRRLAPLVADVVASMRPLAATRRVTLEADLDPEAAAAVDDAGLTRLLLNLLDNAVKYGPHESEVRVTLARAGDRVELGVEDRGPGVPPRDREAVFQPFHRLERDRRGATTGAGIGLSIVRELAARHGGACRVEDNPGGGARFVVELPAVAS